MGRHKKEYTGELAGKAQAASRIGRVVIPVKLDIDPDRPVTIRIPISRIDLVVKQLQDAKMEALALKTRYAAVGRATVPGVPLQREEESGNHRIHSVPMRSDAPVQ